MKIWRTISSAPVWTNLFSSIAIPEKSTAAPYTAFIAFSSPENSRKRHSAKPAEHSDRLNSFSLAGLSATPEAFLPVHNPMPDPTLCRTIRNTMLNIKCSASHPPLHAAHSFRILQPIRSDHLLRLLLPLRLPTKPGLLPLLPIAFCEPFACLH